MRGRLSLVAVQATLLLFVTASSYSQEAFTWNNKIPERRPADGGNGKLVLFDVSHGGTQGNADWVIDGAFSDFADALVDHGFAVREYRGVDKNGDGSIRFTDDRSGNHDLNEAIIEFEAIKAADVFVLAETNRPMRISEYAALKQFVDSGKGLFFIADHYNADRNLNSWDSTEVFNGYNRSSLARFNMPLPYGDFRNPKDATKGWMAETFGLRFRFNAVDFKPGASDIRPPAEAEGLTTGVGPVLIAAGASLAIVDGSKAKGIVYFSTTDGVKSWQHAVEGTNGGLYFGGANEGPVVAISKPSAGKAAFIGDSSPIEDKSPKYAREDNGREKRVHNGWVDPGNAARLSLNIVKWLATPEAYVGFDGNNGHAPGTTTPLPLADVEKDDPDNGRPWKSPSGGYDPWDPTTFRPGAFGAPFPSGSGAGESGSQQPGTAVSVATALAKRNGSLVRVRGIVQAEFNTRFGLKLVDCLDAEDFLAVKIPRNLRDEFNPRLNPTAKGKKVEIVGVRAKYANEPGLKSVRSIRSLD